MAVFYTIAPFSMQSTAEERLEGGPWQSSRGLGTWRNSPPSVRTPPGTLSPHPGQTLNKQTFIIRHKKMKHFYT